jgi:hypothetical protein
VNDTREVRLPSDLCEAVEKKLGSTFGSLEDLLVFILQDLSASDASRFDEAEQRLIEERLRDLGYL